MCVGLSVTLNWSNRYRVTPNCIVPNNELMNKITQLSAKTESMSCLEEKMKYWTTCENSIRKIPYQMSKSNAKTNQSNGLQLSYSRYSTDISV